MVRILIVGAGVAGHALAYWLGRHGFQPTVVERAPAIREGGYKLDIRGAAMEVIDRMELTDQIRKHSTGIRGASYVNGEGTRVASLPADVFGGRDDTVDVEIMRGELVRLLHESTQVDYLFGESVSAIRQHGDAVEVTFASGRARTFDLVVGADGLHSAVRALAFGAEDEFLRYLGYHCAVFTAPNHLGLDRWELLHAVPGKVVNVYGTQDSEDVKAAFFFSSPPLKYDHRDIAQQQRLLLDTYRGVGWEAPRLLSAMRDAPDFFFDSISQIRMPTWSSGRVALVGDAAYCPSPLSGQGTSLALVGAYILAGEMARASDHQQAFDRYATGMRQFVQDNQHIAESSGNGFVLPTRRQIWFRNQGLRMLPYLPWRRLVLRAATKEVDQAARAITLPDYGAGLRPQPHSGRRDHVPD
ncbi:2-polyprenyl-6-methoxyphenol hydroxylase-like FAD-dependent oxidoreductase [Herbihabitans rhizosphaerae]|uniref:2-polyprenyl-6-methoxyphenol hydroxylase-like FAD-dependent oxidoreductase n=1 Tax=Herbihabitans rhizosphaerae TaxID=1872711 RepID=A0A4Q7L6S5_9PSEU|nr:FAD-dependent monooxygenase [Herbihabitans rhizosphaerae]RZS45065.1 2-polyprenyl-6-methoxyphenol hydroxylase-like FAD-dependent oxidoreductase [Herbihabitans rhizosphaerae]